MINIEVVWVLRGGHLGQRADEVSEIKGGVTWDVPPV